MLRRLRICVPVGLSLLLLPAMAYALDGKIDGKPVPEWQVAVDTVWTIVAGILVFLMQAGFAMVEGGFSRAKNVANIMMKNIGDFPWPPLASGSWVSASCSATASWEPPASSLRRARATCTRL